MPCSVRVAVYDRLVSAHFNQFKSSNIQLEISNVLLKHVLTLDKCRYIPLTGKRHLSNVFTFQVLLFIYYMYAMWQCLNKRE